MEHLTTTRLHEFPGWLPALLVLLLCAAVAHATPTTLRIETARSRVVVHVLPKGILSPALHEHHLQPARWDGTVTADADHPGEVRGEMTFAADSLHDQQPKLSPKDVAEVEDQVRGERILDAAKYPAIRFTATALRVQERSGDNLRGILVGTLELHGHSQMLELPVRARWSATELDVEGTASFKQSDFGIAPYARLLGAVAVHDEVQVDFAIVAVPAP